MGAETSCCCGADGHAAPKHVVDRDLDGSSSPSDSDDDDEKILFKVVEDHPARRALRDKYEQLSSRELQKYLRDEGVYRCALRAAI